MANIQKLQTQLKKLQKEIENYQEDCRHESEHIKFDDKKNARWFCIRCDKMLRIPSKQELQDWINK